MAVAVQVCDELHLLQSRCLELPNEEGNGSKCEHGIDKGVKNQDLLKGHPGTVGDALYFLQVFGVLDRQFLGQVLPRLEQHLVGELPVGVEILLILYQKGRHVLLLPVKEGHERVLQEGGVEALDLAGKLLPVLEAPLVGSARENANFDVGRGRRLGAGQQEQNK